jgi:uncharacterized membrane protein YwaF
MTAAFIRNVLIVRLLPVALLLPEVINLGMLYLRWDYLLLAFLGLTLLLIQGRSGGMRLSRLSSAGAIFVIGITLFALWQLIAIPPGTNTASLAKYALGPLKVLAWGLVVRELFIAFRLGTRDLFHMFFTLIGLVVIVQAAELSSPAVREFLFRFYPVAAQERLETLAFRARGPFSGYDAASMFCALACVVVYELGPRSRRGHPPIVPLCLCLGGAFVAARTGFVLAVLYLIVRSSLDRRQRMAALSAFAALLVIANVVGGRDSADETLGGRYVEIVAAIRGADLSQISSVQGTIHMNEELFYGASLSDHAWGAGLISDTTADQLYAKYLFMLGLAGLGMWCLLHSWLIVALALRWGQASQAGAVARTACIIAVMFAIAHWKGGNYYFASRLGELSMLITLLGLAPSRMLDGSPTGPLCSN